ncbi:uncharacterized protein LOC121393337 [Xenopus laevis]|uniref:Uncharacterized protein LOC121393337 n=1 Tax=Xenopus laevis TaxID=8355 RepID=A0A8J1KJL9_XENLA|nr:uncharacterized protein LOC121393337 [Xenopus laevis]
MVSRLPSSQPFSFPEPFTFPSCFPELQFPHNSHMSPATADVCLLHLRHSLSTLLLSIITVLPQKGRGLGFRRPSIQQQISIAQQSIRSSFRPTSAAPSFVGVSFLSAALSIFCQGIISLNTVPRRRFRWETRPLPAPVSFCSCTGADRLCSASKVLERNCTLHGGGAALPHGDSWNSHEVAEWDEVLGKVPLCPLTLLSPQFFPASSTRLSKDLADSIRVSCFGLFAPSSRHPACVPCVSCGIPVPSAGLEAHMLWRLKMSFAIWSI